MKPSFLLALTLACCLAVASHLSAQSPAAGDAAGSSQKKPGGDTQKPAANGADSGGSTTSSNPFPEDTSSVPVMPTAASATAPPPDFNGADNADIRLPGEDTDPVRSPDDPAGDSAAASPDESSSSFKDLEKMLPAPGADVPEKGQKKEPTHQEGAAEDVNVGGYYLERKDWKAALSRFETALVLDPENPDVYWGLAESERHLGDYANAKAHYLKVMDFDPDSRHGKEARKALKEPELANAPAVSSNPPVAQPEQ
jgi:hypothetical protein